MKDYKYILIDIEDGIAVLTINRPKALNAINREMMLEIQDAFSNELPKEKIHGVIITGAGDRAFVAGADIKGFMSFTVEEAQKLAQEGHDTYRAIEEFRAPVIAVVNGFALGGGCELAMACHMRVAEEHAKFGTPEVSLGLIPGYGGTQRLPRLVGSAKAIELLCTADMLNAEEALKYGLANHVSQKGKGMQKAKEILNKVGRNAPLAVKEVLNCVRDYMSKDQDGFKTEVEQFGICFGTQDFKEGVSAFLEKRKPTFEGK